MQQRRALRFVLGDQLSRNLSSLRDLDPASDVVLMAEVMGECTYVRHHPKKIVFVLSAMRHFAEVLRNEGINVDYRTLDDPGNTHSFRGELVAAVRRHAPGRVVVTEPGEWRIWQDMQSWETACGAPVEIRLDDRFIASRHYFSSWAEGRRQLRMEFFYREMRKRTGLLMHDSGEPVGGRWNFDADNRKRLPDSLQLPPPARFPSDATTRGLIDLAQNEFAQHFGDVEPFEFAVTADDAEKAFIHFLRNALPHFGDYQDAMRQNAPTLYHARIALYLNAGLLEPIDVCRRAEAEFQAGRAPLNAVEGFIRQILGWREYVRGIYWLKMPGYTATNYLGASRPLPSFWWTGETDMNCLAQCIAQTKREAYAHHIQRLMVTGNFALIAGLAPNEVCEWYLIVYADAYEWVELPNTHGMALFADGGIMASKPYAASGKYINRMSDYCRHCRYDVRQVTGPDACPFNLLYWNFLFENRDRFKNNQRMTLILKNLDQMPADRLAAIREQAQAFLNGLQ